jgi:hypothetical protein
MKAASARIPVFPCAVATLALLLIPVHALAQELEPGAYWPIPKGVNIVTAVNSFNWGDLAFDPSAPIDEASATINTTAFAFTRAFSLAGRSANAGVVLPVVGGHPELGVSRAFGRWVVEGMAGVWFFTDNTDFFGGRVREQDPIVATQVHLTFKFKRSMWLAADANYYTGGQTTIGGRQNLDLQRNSRTGATYSPALGRHQAIRMSVSRGAYTTIGAAFTSIAVGYNYAWTR